MLEGAPTSFAPDTGARGSNDPAPPTTSSGTTTEPTTSSGTTTELRRRRPQAGRATKRPRHHPDQPIDPNSITLHPPQLFAKKLPPLPDQRIDFTRESGPRRETQRRLAVEAAAARPRRRSRSPNAARVERQRRVGPTQREFRKKRQQK